MARPLRIAFPGAACHVMARGHQGRAVLADDKDRGRFLETLNLRKLGLGERALADGPSGQGQPRGESNEPGDQREAPTPPAPACLRTSVKHEGHKKPRTLSAFKNEVPKRMNTTNTNFLGLTPMALAQMQTAKGCF